MREASFLYAELVTMGAPMGFCDVGGGLAVDYEACRRLLELKRRRKEHDTWWFMRGERVLGSDMKHSTGCNIGVCHTDARFRFGAACSVADRSGSRMRAETLCTGTSVVMQGTATDASASLNYSLQNYANDVVAALQVCINSAASPIQCVPACSALL